MRPEDVAISSHLTQRLLQFSKDVHPLPGLSDKYRSVLVAQFVDSLRRIRFIEVIRHRKRDAKRADPSSGIFDPLRAAIMFHDAGDFDEACWLVFLATQFGKHQHDGWRLAGDIYGGLGGNTLWTWAQTSQNPQAFVDWLELNQKRLKSDGVPRRFSSHRKYESLSPAITGRTVASYIEWVGPERAHKLVFDRVLKEAQGSPEKAFDLLYRSLDSVARFGRLAKFDYLTMLSKLKLAPIQPGSTYMVGATGPFAGAKLLFGAAAPNNRRVLDSWLVELAGYLDLGMQVMEDALCNWQKSPGKYVQFKG